MTLTDSERIVLEIESRTWLYAGSKELAIKDRLGWRPTRYYQVLNALLETERALAHDPVLVNRLRRLRASRRLQARAA